MSNVKPIIGLAGGIGSGKSFVAQLFQQAGSVVIDSDALAKSTLDEPAVLGTLRQWWGDGVVANGRADRATIAKLVFDHPAERDRLERLLHPRVNLARETMMDKAAADSAVKAFVWDSPLLFETGLNAQCDAVVFVDTPRAERVQRVMTSRGWDVAELDRREKLQWTLDKKREMSDYSIANTEVVGESRDAVQRLRQVQEILQRVLATKSIADKSG